MGRINNFDGLRLFAAMLVLWSHMFALSGRPEPMLLGVHSYGNLGVLIFFSISGYLVSTSWQLDPRAFAFLMKRALRVVPALLIALPLEAAIIGMLGLSGFPNNPYHAINGSLWTIPYEALCYIVLLALSLTSRSAPLLMALFVLIGFVLQPTSFVLRHIVDFGQFFAVGWLLRAYPAFLRWTPLLMVTGLWMVIVQHHVNLGLAFIVAPLTIIVGSRSWPVLCGIGRHGDLSYGVYVYAWPVQQITVATLPRMSYFGLLGVSASATLLIAWLSWRYVEAPALAHKPRRQDGPGLGGNVEIRPHTRGWSFLLLWRWRHRMRL